MKSGGEKHRKMLISADDSAQLMRQTIKSRQIVMRELVQNMFHMMSSLIVHWAARIPIIWCVCFIHFLWTCHRLRVIKLKGIFCRRRLFFYYIFFAPQKISYLFDINYCVIVTSSPFSSLFDVASKPVQCQSGSWIDCRQFGLFDDR